jgi:hypothetical protein
LRIDEWLSQCVSGRAEIGVRFLHHDQRRQATLILVARLSHPVGARAQSIGAVTWYEGGSSTVALDAAGLGILVAAMAMMATAIRQH